MITNTTPIWQMTPSEFKTAAQRGRLHGIELEPGGGSLLKIGERDGWSVDQICRVYTLWRGPDDVSTGQRIPETAYIAGYAAMIYDAWHAGREVPDGLLALALYSMLQGKFPPIEMQADLIRIRDLAYENFGKPC